MTDTTLLVLNPSATDIQDELARIRSRGPITGILLSGGVLAWSATDADVLELEHIASDNMRSNLLLMRPSCRVLAPRQFRRQWRSL
ncbi:hypothetical protein [Nocardia donostiensis]|uniref:Uncharacterized protein n=1 Tax=Nocardia donostiensis TaxID=1538463 RepID=A0A1W0B860_9NOCA|nr:hypothetical protein [Nocardia donostiensis]ONM46303.1 hypothetical protein B0T46_23775 [Nocardia donostiensis]OQS18568.1 hypothetical protein B0T44_18935 [Nocardia donostiensis]